MTYKAGDIAKWFLNHVRQLNSEADEEFLTNLKLQKLLYYAQGSSLALLGKPLFDDVIEHWTHGPAVPDVYDQYSVNEGNPIPFDEDYTPVVDGETDDLLNNVYETFGCYSAWGLRNMTRNEDPWKNTSQNQEITTDSIKKYFLENYVEQEDEV